MLDTSCKISETPNCVTILTKYAIASIKTPNTEGRAPTLQKCGGWTHGKVMQRFIQTRRVVSTKHVPTTYHGLAQSV